MKEPYPFNNPNFTKRNTITAWTIIGAMVLITYILSIVMSPNMSPNIYSATAIQRWECQLEKGMNKINFTEQQLNTTETTYVHLVFESVLDNVSIVAHSDTGIVLEYYDHILPDVVYYVFVSQNCTLKLHKELG